ncbi:MAG TPA: hypothetical protein VGP93_03060, partial [Polyangiaceae bacterium]|nr:hypothetical protein [Polyangiaceae bacterium]
STIPPMTAAHVSQDQATKDLVPPFVRLTAIVGIFAFCVGRTISPALRGAREGLDQVIAYTDKAGLFASYLFALIGLIVMILAIMLTFRE